MFGIQDYGGFIAAILVFQLSPDRGRSRSRTPQPETGSVSA